MKRQPAFRRNPDHMPYILDPGNNYYKPQLGIVSDQVCLETPRTEVERNPHWDG